MEINFTDKDIQDCYDWYVVQYYTGGTGPSFSMEDFFEYVWNDMDDGARMIMLSTVRQK